MVKLAVAFFASMLFSVASRPALANAPKCLSQPDDAASVAATQTAAEDTCDCMGSATHFAYVQCVRAVAKQAFAKGTIRKTCLKNVVAPLSKSSCGIPGAVTCCATTARGDSSCQVIPATACKPRSGGTAVPGAEPWCFVACDH